MKPKYQPITYNLLKEKNVEEKGLAVFEQNIGLDKPMKLNMKTIEKFIPDFDYNCLDILLDEDDEFEYRLTDMIARANFYKIQWPAYRYYRKQFNTKGYDRITNTAFTVYEKTIEPALQKYRKTMTAKFIQLYKLGMK